MRHTTRTTEERKNHKTETHTEREKLCLTLILYFKIVYYIVLSVLERVSLTHPVFYQLNKLVRIII